jgi:hypothetical protein
MVVSARVFALVKNGAICVLALFLLVGPVCGALCKAQACDLPKATEKSLCHEPVGSMAGQSAGTTLRGERTCALEEMSVALLADFRSLRSDSIASANAATAMKISVFAAVQLRLVYFPDFPDSRGSAALSDISACSAVPLRI